MGVPVLFSGEKRIVDSAANLWYNWQVVGEAVVLRNSNRRCSCFVLRAAVPVAQVRAGS